MNRRLQPAFIEFRRDTGKFQFVLSRRGKRTRETLSDDLELSYEAALLRREKYLSGEPLISNRSVTLESWYEHYKPKRKKTLAHTTWDIEKYYWAGLSDDIRRTPLNQLTQEIIEAELDEIEALSQRDHTAVFVRTILNAAVKEGVLGKSPFRYSRKKTKKRVPTLSTDQLVLLCQAVPDEARPATLLAAFCALRRGEIMALQYKDINLSNASMQVTVHKAKVAVAGAQHIVEPKAGSARIVPILPDVPATIVAMMHEAFDNGNPEDFIYPDFKPKLNNVIRRTCEREALPLIGLHDLRHVCGTHWVINHGMAFASAALGHGSIQMTIDVYADLEAIVQARTKFHPLQHPLTPAAVQRANSLVDHHDPEVRELALLTLQICS